MEKKNNKKGISLDYMAGYYDRITFAEKSRFRRKQIELMDIQPGERILEVGCGTGSLTLPAKWAAGPNSEVAGIDIAPRMVENAREKAERAGLDIHFQVASIDSIPYPDRHFDRVISSLMFHHLPVGIKRQGLLEIYRVLKPEGRFFLCDFASPHPLTAPLLFPLLIWLSSIRFQLLGKLPALIRECGFRTIERKKRGLFLSYYLIRK